MAEITYPPSDARWVKVLRFCNLLDDGDNKLSPVKFGLWGAHLATWTTFGAQVMTWFGHHLPGVEHAWNVVLPWLAGSHAAHHFDKRERNLQVARLKGGE